MGTFLRHSVYEHVYSSNMTVRQTVIQKTTNLQFLRTQIQRQLSYAILQLDDNLQWCR